MAISIPNAEFFLCQANCFIVAAELATKHRDGKIDPALIYFEMVIVGTHHAFAAELLTKGIMIARTGGFEQGHRLLDLVEHARTSGLYSRLESSYAAKGVLNAINKPFRDMLDSHSEMFVSMRYACEKAPPHLHLDFTSFLCRELRSELEQLIASAS